MGLDIYAGPLCRYYGGAWRTIVQQVAEHQGKKVIILREGEGGGWWGKIASAFGRKADPVGLVRHWRAGLSADMPWVPAEDWEWPESIDLPYQTDKPDFLGFGAVQVWAAYSECGDLQRPVNTPDDWSNDPAFLRIAEGSREFVHTVGPELWLPIRVEKPFDAAEPNGIERKIGAVHGLWEDLRKLNDMTWNADDNAIHAWRAGGFDPDNLDSVAKWGFSIWYGLAEFAVRNRVPMRLDY
jgi:hypothetical protein